MLLEPSPISLLLPLAGFYWLERTEQRVVSDHECQSNVASRPITGMAPCRMRRTASIWVLSSIPFARSLVVSINWDSQALDLRNPCCMSDRILCWSKNRMMELWMMCSRTLHHTEVRDIGW